jgi:hypothetical protein
VAAYFAFYEVVENEPDEAYRVVWCLYKKRVSDAGHVTIIDPDTTFNVRLLSQRGLLTDAGEAACIEDVIQRTYADRPKGRGLMKCLIPVKDRELALKSLNLMNINHITLFPDVEGSSQYANLKLQIPSY